MAQFTAYEKAGRLIRLLAWIEIIASVAIVAAIVLPSIAGSTREAIPVEMYILFLFLALLAFFLLTLGKAVKEHKPWGRVVGIIYGILLLTGFPLGTVLGVYILWCLIKGWDDQPVKQAA